MNRPTSLPIIEKIKIKTTENKTLCRNENSKNEKLDTIPIIQTTDAIVRNTDPVSQPQAFLYLLICSLYLKFSSWLKKGISNFIVLG